MNVGEIVETGTVDAVLADPQAEYTRNLLADTPDVDRTPF
jgi:ABC-type oligopeptide transport system ATPase subunit